MDGYGQFCPVAKAAEIICKRWTPLILRELLLGTRRFADIRRGVPLVSPTLLSQRLKELERVGVVVRADDGGYDLTEAGRELFPILQGFGEWGQRWARSDYRAEELDAGTLLWDVRRFVSSDGLRAGRTVLEFEFPGEPPGRRSYWVVLDTDGVDVCLVDPGFEVDVCVRAELASLAKVWMGDAVFVDEMREGRISIEGPAALARKVPAWFGRHPILADVENRRAGTPAAATAAGNLPGSRAVSSAG